MNKGVKKSLFAYMDTMPRSTFGAWELYAAMYARTGIKTMPSTLLQYAREYADISGASLECIKPDESTYKFTPGFKISGAIMGGKE